MALNTDAINGEDMDYKKKSKNKLLNRFLVQILTVMMVFSMMPSQSLAFYAATDDTGTAVEQPAQTEGQTDKGDEGEPAAQPSTPEDKGDQGEPAAVPDDQDKQVEPAVPAADQQGTDQQKTDNAKPAADNAKPAADAGKKDAGDSSVVENTTPEPETPAEVKDDGKKDGAKAAGISPADAAEENYGEHGKAKTFKVTLSDNKDAAEAGEQITYNIDVTMYQAAFYKYDGQNQEPMFKEWKNITVELQLPQVTIPGTNEKRKVVITGTTDVDIQSYSLVDESTNTWEIVLKKTTRDATNSNSINLDINTRITGNGELPDGIVLPEAKVTFSADFDVRVDEDETVAPVEYSKTVTDTTDEIPLSTPDDWMLTKSPYGGEKAYTIDEKNKTVTVHYLVKYGLRVGEGDEAHPSEDKNVYTRYGRVPFANDIKLTDTPTLTLHDGVTTVTPQLITVTPVDTGYVYKDGTSADQDGKPKTITVQSGQPASLPYAVVGTNNREVAENTPYFSKYNVDMVYDYRQFMVWYYENADNTNSHSENRADIAYKLFGQTDEKNTNDDGEMYIPGYIRPGHITIEKFIVDYDSEFKKLYNSSIQAPISGPATFEVLKDDGSPAKIYYKDTDGKYREISGNTVTIDPAGTAPHTNGRDGKIAFYLNAGTYSIKETAPPSYTEAVGDNPKTITVNEGGEATVAFNNKEKLGEVKVHKTDDSNNLLPVEGAKFGLYEDRQHTRLVQETETNSSGDATFKRLIPKTYYLWEISAPDGYIKSDEVKEIKVTANNTSEAAIQVKNHSNRMVIKLQKRYSTVNKPKDFIEVTSDHNTFKNAFRLQKSIEESPGHWTDWTDDSSQRYSPDDKGVVTARVDIVDEEGHKIRYRFVETVPQGYFGSKGQEPGTDANSDSVVPADGEDSIIMDNLKPGFIELTKKKVVVNSSSGAYVAQNQTGKVFKLYRIAEGDTEAKAVATLTTGTDGKCTYSDLLSIDPNGKKYTYYVVETNQDPGYTWITDTEISVEGETEKKAAVTVGSFQDSTSSKLTPVSYNIQQEIVIGIIKKDRLTGDQLENAKFDVTDGTKTWHITSRRDQAAKLQIELGQVYTITETGVPTGYYMDPDELSVTRDTRGWKVGVKKNDAGVVIGFAIYDKDGKEVTSEDLTFRFEDTPYKKIYVTKKAKKVGTEDSTAQSTSALSDVILEVYIKNGDKFEVYKDKDGNPVTIKGDGSSVIYLPDSTLAGGEYYLHEKNPPETVVNPDKYYDEYAGKGEYDINKKMFFFGPYEVKKPPLHHGEGTGDGDTEWHIDLINISNTGNLIVQKEIYDTENKPVTDGNQLRGFRMEVYRANESGQPTGSRVAYANTPVGGKLTFNNLPVYDAAGNKISYVVEEVYTNNQANIYYNVDNYLSSKHPQMDLRETADAGVIKNYQYLSVDVVKMYYDKREYELTHLKYELEGAVIALYKNNGDGTYTYIDEDTTNSKGKVSFGKLTYSADGFVAIEVSIPDRPEYTYMVPAEGKLLKDMFDSCPTTLTEAQVNQLSKAKITSQTDPKYSGEIDNVIPWTQIHITKYEEGTSIKLDGANFTLYKEVLEEGQTELTFDAENCTVVGEYTSGTWIQLDEPQKGEFQTDILESADNIVYWLVETKAPSGYSRIPSEKYVLFRREGTTYTNNSNGGRSTKVVDLKDNKINYHKVYNHREIGPEGTENWAYIEFNKWRQKEETVKTPRKDLKRSDFALMPNATFKLYAVYKTGDKTGDPVLLLDTITTGDENLVNGSATTGYGVSRSMDAWTIFNTIETMYPEDWDKVITYHASPDSDYPDATYPYVVDASGKPVEDAQGNRTKIKGTFWLNAVLIETSGSSKYELDLHNHHMQITFPPHSLYLGNDKYAVPNLEAKDSQGEYTSDFCDNDGRRLNFEDNKSQSMAIVDYLAIDNSVVLRHFGYDPEEVGYHKFHDELETIHEDSPYKFISKEVTFALEKFNTETNNWEPWDPKNNKPASETATFKADGNGYHFDSGLNPGEYRVYMTTPADGYENFYPKKYPKLPDKALAFHFTVVVSDRSQTFTTYSPSKAKMTVKKTDMSGTAITSEAEFKLKEAKAGEEVYSKTEKTNSDGEAVFTELPADYTFTLSEEKAPAGFTNEYFKQLFIKQNPDYEKLVNGDGYPVSYTTNAEPNGIKSLDGSDLSERVIIDKWGEKTFAFSAPNINTVEFKLNKVDAQKGTPLKDAEFLVYYHAFDFDKVGDSYTVPEFSPEDDSGWIRFGTVESGNDGTVKINDNTFADKKISPGVYYVEEIKAPPDYDLPDPPAQLIVMTGGLDLKIAKSDRYSLYTVPGVTGELTFKDMPKVKMIIDKIVDFGDIPAMNYSFEFELKDSEETIMPGEPNKATGTVDGSDIKKTNAEFAHLSQGATYYLKEKAADNYKLKTVTVDGKEISPETSGDFKDYYKIDIPKTGANVAVSVTNVYMKAQVTIFKYDGETGEGLSRAAFEVLKEDEETPIPADVIDNQDGSYTVVIPFENIGENKTIFIHEIRAPEKDGKKYTIDEANSKIKVENLKPGDNLHYKFTTPQATDNKYALPNYEGTSVKILKYGGIYGRTDIVELKGALFQMYFSTDGGANWSTWHPAEPTDDQGIAEFLVLPGYEYALAEINDVKGYVGLESIYEGSKKLQTKQLSDLTLYLLDIDWDKHEAGQEYNFTGYNIPYLKLTVNKEDISGKVSKPDVDFHVYQVPNGTPTTLTDEQITQLAENSKRKIEGRTKDSTYTNDQFLRPGETYLAVEDHAIATGTQFDDYSIIKDDSRVVSYEVFSVPEKNYDQKNGYSVTFKNNKGDATVHIAKTLESIDGNVVTEKDDPHIDSLTVKEAKLSYKLKPTTTNGYALDAYRLKDSGLTATPIDATLADEWYDITEVIVGQGSMDNYLVGADEATDYVIEATVTFVDFDGTEYKMSPVNVSNGNISVIPTGTGGKKIKSFYVDYASPELETITGYVLGQNFTAGETVVKATVFKQEKPEEGVVTSVTKIRNDTDVMLKYTPWTSVGKKDRQETVIDNANVETPVDSTKAPKIQFTKGGPDTDTAVQLGSPITYELKIDNITEEEIDFTDPIIVDLLPQGIVVDQSKEFVKVTEKPDTITGDPTVTTGYAGDSQYVNIAFNGTVGKGKSLTVELTANITDAVTNYGNQFRNFAFATSKEVGVATSDNTTGAVIKDDDGLWASALEVTAKAIDCPQDRALALKAALGKQGTYGYLGDLHENFWVTDNELVCVKAEYGPADGGVYRTDKVSVLSNDKLDDTKRTMHYQLTVNNISTAKRTNLAVMDIMPVVGDQRINNTDRGSNWPLYFDMMGPITVNGDTVEKSDYTVYYYTDDATQFNADKIAETVNDSKSGCPDGWTTDKPDKATAIIVAFNYDPTDATQKTDDKTVVLEGNNSVQIEYTAKTIYREAEELNKIVFTNAANDFNFGYSTFSPPSTADKAKPYDPLGSNVVEVTIAPPEVMVGGDVWIDADSNGKQDDLAQNWYLNYDIVQKLVGTQDKPGQLNVTLNTSNERNLKTTSSKTIAVEKTGSDPDNYGIGHFEFEHLTSAKIRETSQATNLNWLDDKKQAGNLVGKNPYTYHMVMDYSGNTFFKTINIVNPRGSYDPEAADVASGGIPEIDRIDDNFEAFNKSVEHRTEQFFLHQTSKKFDMTKDYGLNINKTLELTKVDRADESTTIKDVEFKIYGPFDHDEDVTEADLTDDKLVDTLTTDADGKIKKAGLFFFKKYAIVESKPAKGYSIEGVQAVGNITELDEGKWILNVPAYNTEIPEEGYTEEVLVKDPKNIKVEVEKIWDDDDDAYGTRPESIKVMLYTDKDCTVEAKDAEGKTVESITLDSSNDWKGEWTNLPRYKVEKHLIGPKTETPIIYYVKETDSEGHELNGYIVDYKSSKDATYGDQKETITNTPISTGIEVKKEWEDTDDVAARVTEVTFRVEQSSDGESWTPAKLNGKEIILTIGRKPGETISTMELRGLPAYDSENNPLKYRAVEISIKVDGQTLEVKDGKVGCYEVTETYTFAKDDTVESATETDLSEIKNVMATTEFNVEKTFVDDTFNLNKDIKSIKVKLQRKSAGGDWTDVEDYDLTQSGGWKHNWKGLPKYDLTGNAYDYRAFEVSYTTKDGKTINVVYNGNDKTSGTIGAYIYTSKTEGTADNGFTTYIENKLVKGGLQVTKEWENSDKAKVPGSLTIKLKAFADGKEINISGVKKSTKLSKSNDWTDDTTWAELPVYDVDGNKISYELTESGKGKYKAEYEVYYNGSVIKDGDGEKLSVNIYPNEDVEVTFINTLNSPKTGDEMPLAPYMALGLASLTGLLYLVYRRRRTN